MCEQDQALLRHDVQAALLNHSGVHREIEDSLQQLGDVLKALVPSADAGGDCNDVSARAKLLERVDEIVRDDLDQCLPMLQLSSERLSQLMSRLVAAEPDRKT